VIFDMTELQVVASLFLGLLVNFRRGLVAQGSRIQMAGVRPNIRELFQVTRLEELFEFVSSAPPSPNAATAV
jgi:anti-anti-sigma regulatory factor